MTFRLLLTLFAIICSFQDSSSARGGDVVGNGADVVICDDVNGSTWTELLDLHEARRHHSLTLTPLLPTPSPVLHHARAALDRLRAFGPQVDTAFLAARIEAFLAEAKFVGDADLPNPPNSEPRPDLVYEEADQGGTHIEASCEKKQLIIRFRELRSDGIRYLIHHARWEQLPVEDRAAAIVHEAIYGWAVEMAGHSTSQASRILNGVLHSDEFRKLDWPRFQALGRDLGFCDHNDCFGAR